MNKTDGLKRNDFLTQVGRMYSKTVKTVNNSIFCFINTWINRGVNRKVGLLNQAVNLSSKINTNESLTYSH